MTEIGLGSCRGGRIRPPRGAQRRVSRRKSLPYYQPVFALQREGPNHSTNSPRRFLPAPHKSPASRERVSTHRRGTWQAPGFRQSLPGGREFVRGISVRVAGKALPETWSLPSPAAEWKLVLAGWRLMWSGEKPPGGIGRVIGVRAVGQDGLVVRESFYASKLVAALLGADGCVPAPTRTTRPISVIRPRVCWCGHFYGAPLRATSDECVRGYTTLGGVTEFLTNTRLTGCTGIGLNDFPASNRCWSSTLFSQDAKLTPRDETAA